MSPNSDRKYRVGIIGCGRMATGGWEDLASDYPHTFLLPYSHAGAIKEVPELELVSGADTSTEALSEFKRRWNVPKVYTDYAGMLEKERLDIVCIASPAPTHYEALMKSVKAGVRGIYCEKPISTTLEQADRMVEECDKAHVKLLINCFRRWDPYYQRAKDLIDKQRIGRLTSIVGYCGEALLAGGAHLADLFRFFAGDVELVFGHVNEIKFADAQESIFQETRKGGAAYIRFKNGIDGYAAYGDGFELDLLGTRGRMRIGNVDWELWEGDKQEGESWKVKYEGFPAAMRHTAPMVNALYEMIECIDKDTESRSSGRDGRAALEIILAIVESARSNKPVKLPLTNRSVGMLTWE